MTPLIASELPEVAQIVTATTARMTAMTAMAAIRGNASPRVVVRDEAEARATSGQGKRASIQRARTQKRRPFRAMA